MILCANPKMQYLARKSEIDSAISKVLNGGRYILGDEVENFEHEFAEYIGVDHAIGVGNGTDALHLALVACGVKAGDEVVTVSHTAVATISAIEMCGAKPVFVDIDPVYYTLDPAKFEAALTEKTKVVIPVHIYGLPADLDSIISIAHRHNVLVLEDCAQAHGAVYKNTRVGAWGDIACFSFYPTKNLGAIGDGGMVVTSNPELAGRVRLLREYGWAERYVSSVKGWNSRLDEIQAAVLRVKLRYLDVDNNRRLDLAKEYYKELSALPQYILPRERAATVHVFHLYVIRSKVRDSLQLYLNNEGVRALVHYPVPVHQQPAYMSSVMHELRETERAAQEVLSLPMYPELTDKEQRIVIRSLQQFVGK